MMSKNEIANLLRVLAQSLDKLSESEFEQLLDGKGHLKFVDASPKKAKGKISENSKMSDDQLRELIPQIQAAKTREEVREMLHKDQRVPLKDNLERLARLLKIHVNKHDKREVIEDKVIESVVGVKLRSEAILGLNLKGSGAGQNNS